MVQKKVLLQLLKVINMNIKNWLLPLLMIGSMGCQSQTAPKMTSKNNNPLLCDPEKGICEIPDSSAAGGTLHVNSKEKAVRVLYFTDPICSSCWGIEPQLRKLKLEYGNDIQIEYHMGGLLPDWSYNSGGISKPADVAGHWDEVSHYYDMPIDGDVWLEDPLASSYPPSIAVKAAQMQDEKKAVLFMRRIREMVFLEKKNITKWEHLAAAATECGLDAVAMQRDYEGEAREAFRKDLELTKKMGVRGFPTLYFLGKDGKQVVINGYKPYKEFEQAVLKCAPAAVKMDYEKDWQHLFAHYKTLTRKEYAELSNVTVAAAEKTLNELTQDNKLQTTTTKNGKLWMRK